MRISIDRETYKGVDGTSLTLFRCDQYLTLYELSKELGDKLITYKELQDIAEKKDIFAGAKAKSAIRTLCPLMRDLRFISYTDSTLCFPAKDFFTKDGQIFIELYKLYKQAKLQGKRQEIVDKIYSLLRTQQRQGLINMYGNPDCKQHNMWVALSLLKALSEINWNEYLFSLSCKEQEVSFPLLIEKIENNRLHGVEYEFVNDQGKPVATTAYSYLKSFLEEAEVIESRGLNSKLSPKGLEITNNMNFNYVWNS